MAHELTLNRVSGKYEMAFAGETPWHKLGQRVTEGASLETWAREGHMEWSALAAPVTYAFGDQTRTMPDRKVIYRSDTGEALSVMGDGYKIVQPLEVLEFFRDLTERNEWHIHTVGVLNGGKRFWALARNHTEGQVVPGDTVKGNLLLATSLDGSMKTTAAMTAIRVVCANTIRLALDKRNDIKQANGKASRVEISHRSEFDAAAVKESIGVARESFDAFMASARELAERSFTPDQMREMLHELIGKPRVSTVEAEPIKFDPGMTEFQRLMIGTPMPIIKAPKEHRNVTKIMELFEGAGMGSDHIGSRGTRWGALNAVSEFVDHSAGRTQDNRLTSAWFGDGAKLKQSAFEMLLAK